MPSGGLEEKLKSNKTFQGFGLEEAGIAGLAAAGTENLITSASRVSSLDVAWMTTRSPAASSLAWDGLSSLLDLTRKTVEAANFTSTDLPSTVFTTTESALIFSTVPLT